MQNIIKALAKPDDTALVSIFVPGELLTAAGITPYSVEAMSCFIAGTRCEQAFLAQTESEGFPETMCSYHRVFFGSVHDRIGTEAQMYHLHKPCLRWKHDDVSLSETEISDPGLLY